MQGHHPSCPLGVSSCDCKHEQYLKNYKKARFENVRLRAKIFNYIRNHSVELEPFGDVVIKFLSYKRLTAVLKDTVLELTQKATKIRPLK